MHIQLKGELVIAQWENTQGIDHLMGLFMIQHRNGNSRHSYRNQGLAVHNGNNIIQGTNLDYITPARLTITFEE